MNRKITLPKKKQTETQPGSVADDLSKQDDVYQNKPTSACTAEPNTGPLGSTCADTAVNTNQSQGKVSCHGHSNSLPFSKEQNIVTKQPPANKWNSNSINRARADQEKKRTKSESTYAGTVGSAKNIATNTKKATNTGDICASSRLTRQSDILEVRGESQCSAKSPNHVLSCTDNDSIYPQLLLNNTGNRNSVHIIETRGINEDQKIDLNASLHGPGHSPARVRMPPVSTAVGQRARKLSH